MPAFTVFRGSSDGNPRKSTTVKPDELLGDMVLLRVTVSGLCGTDLHSRTTDMALGHEGVGVVEALGPAVKELRKGDRVGWGYETNSCENCLECLQGQEVFCSKRAFYGECNLDQGSFATHAVWREAFLHKIPDEITDEAAAPLQCAGATVYQALQGVQPNEVIGIMGVGGLGHLAIPFAAKMGCRVVVLSRSESKRDQAMQLGAHRFVITGGKDHKSLEDDVWPINRLLVTTSILPDWETTLPLLAMRPKIYPLTVSGDNVSIPSLPLVVRGITIHGSPIASRAVHREMLRFAAFHKINPIVEKFPMTEEGIKTAMDRLEEGKVYYRAVLVN